MSIPSDNNGYDFDILSKISESLSHIYASTDPSTQDITVEKLVLKALSSAKKAGMLPGKLTHSIEAALNKFKDRSIRQLSRDELEYLQSTLSQNPRDTDSGIGSVPSSEHSSRAPSPMLSEAKKTSSWIEDFFPTHGLFLPAFTAAATFPSTKAQDLSQQLSKEEAALLQTVLEENGYTSIEDYQTALSSAKAACPSSYTYDQQLLAVMDATLQPAVLQSGLKKGASGFPLQFQKDNLDSRRMTWLTVNIHGSSYSLDSQEHIEECIAQLTSAAKEISSDQAEIIRDSLLLMASQTLFNSLQKGKNDLAIEIQLQTDITPEGSISPSSVTIKDLEVTDTGCTFTCDLSYHFSYNVKLAASEDQKAALEPIFKKLGMGDIFSGNIEARFEADINTATQSLRLRLVSPPSVTVEK